MIFLWFKIMYYKMIKLVGRKTRAEAGEDPRARAHVTGETSGEVLGVALDPATRDGLVLYGRQAGKATASTARLRELIDKGLVRYPDEAGDLYRVAALEDDRARREQMAMESGYPGACPCGGRHYPSPYSCRWCRCHDPRNEHHRPDALGLMQVIKPSPDMAQLAEDARDALEEIMDTRQKLMAEAPSNEIVCCPRCGHPQHPGNGGRCAFLVTGQDTEGPLMVCRCVVTESEA